MVEKGTPLLWIEMPLRVTCTQCGIVLGAPESAIGKVVKCTKCGHVFTAQLTNSTPAPAKPSGPPPLPITKRDAAEVVDPKPRRRSSERLDDDESTSQSDRARSRRNDDFRPRPARSYEHDEDDSDTDDDERPRSRSRRGPAKKKSRVLLYVLLGLGALFILCGGGGGVALYFALSEGTPREYTVQEGSVSAQFPGTPVRKVEPNGRINYELEFWSTAYMTYLEPIEKLLQGRPGLTQDETKFLMEYLEQNFTAGSGYQILRRNQLTYQGFHSVEFEVKDAKNHTYLMRVFVTSRHMIVVGFGSRGQLDRAKATRFLDSVKILDPKPRWF